MDFRAAALPPSAAHMPVLFSQPTPLPPPPQAGIFLYPGLSSPVKPPSHLLAPPAGAKVSRNTATVPPLHQSTPPSPAQQASAAAAAAVAGAQNSSFAAALKSLARNAGDGKEPGPGAGKPREPPTGAVQAPAPVMSPKRVPLHVPRAPHTDNPPPVVAIAPTPTHQRRDHAAVSTAGDITKADMSTPHIPSSGSGGTGFQPYRPEERALLDSLYPAGYPPGAGLYPPLPPTAAAYAARRPEERYLESLYQLQPMQHQLYGLEEQMYLERLGLLRPGLGVGGLPGGTAAGLSAYSPLLSAARYPPELLHSPLYLSQSLYLQERLKLEEDTRRTLESERERGERERDRGERERERDKSREPVVSRPSPVRDRSPIRPPVSSHNHTVPHEQRNGTMHERSPRSTSSSDQQTSPAAYRPYLASPVHKPAVSAAPPLDLSARAAGGKNATIPDRKRSHHKKTTVVRPFEDAPPAMTKHAPPPPPPADTPLNLSEKRTLPESSPAAIITGSSLTNGVVAPPQTAMLAPMAAQVQPKPQPKPELKPKLEPKPEPKPKMETKPKMELKPKMEPKLEPLTSPPERTELPQKQVNREEATPPAVRQSDSVNGPACEAASQTEKMHVPPQQSLATHSYRNGKSPSPSADTTVPVRKPSSTASTAAEDVYAFTEEATASPDRLHPSKDGDGVKSERRMTPHTPGASSPDNSRSSDPETEPRPSSRLTAALNHTADVQAKQLFLDRLGLRPITCTVAATPSENAATTTSSLGVDVPTLVSPRTTGPLVAGASPSLRGSPSAAAPARSPSGSGSPVAASTSISPSTAAATGSSSSQRKNEPRHAATSCHTTTSAGSSGTSSSGSGAEDSKPPSKRSRCSPSSRSGKSSRPSPQARNASPEETAATVPGSAARTNGTAGQWPGLQAITQLYTAYNKERTAALEQAKRHGDHLRQQKTRLEETSRTLALRLNRQVAYRNLQWQRRDAVQEQLDRLTALVRSLPSRGRRKP